MFVGLGGENGNGEVLGDAVAEAGALELFVRGTAPRVIVLIFGGGGKGLTGDSFG